MQKWFGSSGVCINENGELLMVLQGKPEEDKKWSVPSGGQEKTKLLKNVVLERLKKKQDILWN
jgi:aminoglycoside 6'-N-acetyltransferase